MKRITVYPGFNSRRSFLNDIALLELENELTFTNAVLPIPILSKGTVSTGKAKLSGWDVTQARKFMARYGNSSDTLLMVDLTIVPKAECEKYYAEIKWKDLYHNKLDCDKFGKTLFLSRVHCRVN